MLLGLGGCLGRERGGAGSEGTGPSTTDERSEGPTRLAATPPTDSSTSGAGHPGLSSPLADLLAAEDRAAYAREHGLAVDGPAVLVVVELVSADAELPPEHVRSVERREGALVRAYVPFESLGPLASEDVVRFVRPPISGSPANGTEDTS